MAMPQKDNYIVQIRRLEGLIAYAEQQQCGIAILNRRQKQ